MTTLREAAQQALSAIEDSGHKADLVDAAYTLRAALEQPEPEPVAWMQKLTGVIRSDWHFDKSGYVPLYTEPPQRKPLTGAKIEELMDLYDVTSIDFVRAIEAAHGIKE